MHNSITLQNHSFDSYFLTNVIVEMDATNVARNCFRKKRTNFFLNFSFFQELAVNYVLQNFCRILDSNRSPLVLEATMPQPVSNATTIRKKFSKVFILFCRKYLFISCFCHCKRVGTKLYTSVKVIDKQN